MKNDKNIVKLLTMFKIKIYNNNFRLIWILLLKVLMIRLLRNRMLY